MDYSVVIVFYYNSAASSSFAAPFFCFMVLKWPDCDSEFCPSSSSILSRSRFFGLFGYDAFGLVSLISFIGVELLLCLLECMPAVVFSFELLLL